MSSLQSPREAERQKYNEAVTAYLKAGGPRPIPPKWHPDYRTVLPELVAAGVCDEHGNRLSSGAIQPGQPPQAPHPVAVGGQPGYPQQVPRAPAGYVPPGAGPQAPSAHAGRPPFPGQGRPAVSNIPQRHPNAPNFQPAPRTGPMVPQMHARHQGGYISNHQAASRPEHPRPAPSHQGFHSPTPVPPAMSPRPQQMARPHAPMPPQGVPQQQVPAPRQMPPLAQSAPSPPPRMAPPEQLFAGQPTQQPVSVGQAAMQPQPGTQPQPVAQPQPAQGAPGPQAHVEDGRVKVAVVGPRLLMTGAERFVMDLLKHIDPTQIRWEFIVALQPEFFIPQIEVQNAVDQGAQLAGAAPGVVAAAQAADVVIVWGMSVPPELATAKVIHLPDVISLGEPAIDPARLQPQRTREEVRQELRLGDEHKAVGFIGRLHNLRNPYALVQAMKQLPEEYVAVFVGEGDQAVEVRTYCEQQLGGVAGGRFRFLGSRPDIGDLLAGLDAVMVPSLTATHGYTILEAWAAGVPVMATPVGLAKTRGGALMHLPRALAEIPQHLRHEALQTPELAERVGKAYAEAIVDVFESPDDTAKRVARAKEVAAEQTPQAFGARWTQTILEAASK